MPVSRSYHLAVHEVQIFAVQPCTKTPTRCSDIVPRILTHRCSSAKSVLTVSRRTSYLSRVLGVRYHTVLIHEGSACVYKRRLLLIVKVSNHQTSSSSSTNFKTIISHHHQHALHHSSPRRPPVNGLPSPCKPRRRSRRRHAGPSSYQRADNHWSLSKSVLTMHRHFSRGHMNARTPHVRLIWTAGAIDAETVRAIRSALPAAKGGFMNGWWR